MNKIISLVVPVFRNMETLAEVHKQIIDIRLKCFPHLEIEIVFVDDGSPDGSWDELKRLYLLDPTHVVLVKLSRNFGQVAAILAGYGTARGDAIITMSADLQDPVDLIPQMVSGWENGNEMVIAHRVSRDDDFISTQFSKLAYGIARCSNPRIPDGGFDFLLISRRAANIILGFKGRHRFFQGDVLWLGLQSLFIPYVRKRRLHGKSGWTISKKFKYFTDLLLDSSYFPIRLMSALGFVTAMIGIAYVLIILIQWFRGNTPFTGWAPIMVVLLVIGGLIMMMLGMIGEYLWRIYDDVKMRPLYIVESEHLSPSVNSATEPQSTSQRGICEKI